MQTINYNKTIQRSVSPSNFSRLLSNIYFTVIINVLQLTFVQIKKRFIAGKLQVPGNCYRYKKLHENE